MKIELKLLTARKQTSEGFPLVFEISHKNVRRMKTIAYCESKFFIVDHKMISNRHPDFDFLGPLLMDYKIKARKIVLSGLENVDEALRILFMLDHDLILFDVFGTELKDEMKLLAAAYEKKKDLVLRNKVNGNLKVYANVLKQFADFDDRILLGGLCYSDLQKFKQLQLASGNSKNTVHLYLRTLRAIYNKGIKKYNLTDQKPFDGVFDGLKVKSYANKKKYLDKLTVERLEKIETKNADQKYVDLFLLQFYFAGADLIDVYFLRKSQLQKDYSINETMLLDISQLRPGQYYLRLTNDDKERGFRVQKY